MALATGKIATDEQKRKLAMDLKTLYVRFKSEIPNDEGEVRKLLNNHPDIKFVRIQRQQAKNIRSVFVEFGSEAQCESAKESLTTGPNAKDKYYVDFVGIKSKGGGKPVEERGKRGKRPINPSRLFIRGLVDGLDADKLKQLFPKCVEASIPSAAKKKGNRYGFVQFSNPADAKAAFDASQKLTIASQGGGEGHQLTVLYATKSKRSVKMQEKENQVKRDEKRKAKQELKKKKVEEKKELTGKSPKGSTATKEESEEDAEEEDEEASEDGAEEEEEEDNDEEGEEEGDEDEEGDEGDEDLENDAESSEED